MATPETVLPNLVVIGAAKCGTTSLHQYLRAHPQVFMSATKELNFFVDGERFGRWYRGVSWYRSHFPVSSASVYGESSPRYTSYPFLDGVPERMHAVIPEAKLIFLVGDPVRRAISHHAMRVRDGDEGRGLAEALRDEGSDYVARSRYALQLERFLEWFPLASVLVLEKERLDHDRSSALQDVFAFLGVDSGYWSRTLRLRHNEGLEGTELRSVGATARRVLDPVLGRERVDRVGRVLPAPVTRLYRRPRRPAPQTDPELRAWLAAELRPDAERLRTLTGLPLSSWSV